VLGGEIILIGVLSALALAITLMSCRRPEAGSEISQPVGEPKVEAAASDPSDPIDQLDPEGQPPRWVIDGTTLAADPSLPVALDRALREHGRASDEVQDRILYDLNGDAQLDAVVLLPALAVAGVYDHLVLLSGGDSVRVHSINELVPGASFSAAVIPLVDGPTLVAVAPRLGGCERGPEWTFLRPTGALLELVGTVRVEDYDCAVADASVGFERGDDGRVAAVVVRHGPSLQRYRWDGSVGSFAVE
jgi:hypothetical protein